MQTKDAARLAVSFLFAIIQETRKKGGLKNGAGKKEAPGENQEKMVVG
ncbi:hypothetical protein SFC66_15290 [Terribacillus saccharophilus]